MSRKLLAFLLSELSTVRVLCKKCGGVIEFPCEKLAFYFQSPKCPLCRHDFGPSDDDNPFAAIAKAVATFKLIHGQVDVEFVLPDPGE